jgi:drug/metabolite transporter (DMT)-like permease
VVAAALFAPWLDLRRAAKFSRADWLRMAGVGVLGYAAPLWVGTVGQQLSSAANASLLVGVEPVSIVFLSAAFLGEPLTRLKAGSIACGLLGAFLIVAQGAGRTLTPSFQGDLILFLHGFLWSLYTVLGKPVLEKTDAMTFSAWTTVIGLVALAPFAAPGAIHGVAATPQAWAAFAFVSIGVSWGGVAAWNKALELIPASQLANFIFLQPLIGVGLAAFGQGDRLTPWSVAGGLLIIGSVYGASREKEEGLKPAQAAGITI